VKHSSLIVKRIIDREKSFFLLKNQNELDGNRELASPADGRFYDVLVENEDEKADEGYPYGHVVDFAQGFEDRYVALKSITKYKKYIIKI
jgi:hypothetical protein